MAALMLAAPGMAQDSHCASLPATAEAAGEASPTIVRPQLAPGGLTCPRGFVLEPAGAASRCIQPGQRRSERLSPRADCYRDLPLGPVDPVRVERPTLACPTRPSVTTIARLSGRNAGWTDLELSAPAAASLTVATLAAGGARTPEEDPVRRGCFPHACRLVRITTRAGTPARVRLTLASADGSASTSFDLETEGRCPSR